jgi:spore germination cell wall hydrolase CwlJ-like protein
MKSKVLLILAVLVCSQTSSAFWEIFANTKTREQYEQSYRRNRTSAYKPQAYKKNYTMAEQYKMYGRGNWNTNRLSCQNPQGDYNCMVCNCFHEAGNQSEHGQVAVGLVVMTRTRTYGYPNTVCGAIKQYKQFSWWDAPGAMDRSPVPGGHRCFESAKKSLKFTSGRYATHYHANYVNPRWNRNKVVVARIGAHIFYNSTSVRSRYNPHWGGRSIQSVGLDKDGVLQI